MDAFTFLKISGLIYEITTRKLGSFDDYYLLIMLRGSMVSLMTRIYIYCKFSRAKMKIQKNL